MLLTLHLLFYSIFLISSIPLWYISANLHHCLNNIKSICTYNWYNYYIYHIKNNYLELEHTIKIKIAITITTTNNIGCVNNHIITNSSTKNPTIFPMAASPEKSPLQAAIIEPTINIKINTNMCITFTPL